MSLINKIDSNLTGLRYCENVSLGVLAAAASQIWKPFEPNSYKDFGGKVTTVARNPINSSRQRKKGVVTDIEANGGFDTDITQTNLQDILQGFFFADLRKKNEKNTFTAVTSGTKKYTHATAGFLAGDLVFGAGFTNSGNNGLKTVTAIDATDVTVAETVVTEVPPATASLVTVGFQFAIADATIVVSGSLPTLVCTAKDMTQLGIIPGEWVFIGGDTSTLRFAGATNNGFARVRSVTATVMTFDKTAGTMTADSGTGKTVQLFVGRVLKNELGTLVKRRSYDLERTLGYSNDADITRQQADYLVGGVPNEFSLNCPTANKVTASLSFAALHADTLNENTSGANTLLSKAAVVAGSAANAPSIVESDAFNTSSDVSRINLSVVTPGNPNPTPLFAFVQDFTLTLTNNIKPNKAIGVTGAFEQTAGTFEVGGKLTAYFADVAATDAVNNNSDISLDAHFVKANAGLTFDLPLITLGDGLPKVEQDQAITLPLDMQAATGAKIASTMDYTAMLIFWDYLPSAADS